jgi:hypothetical protein
VHARWDMSEWSDSWTACLATFRGPYEHNRNVRLTWTCTSRSAGTPYFKDYMTSRDVYHYPTQHYDHHRQQLTLASARP